MANKANLANSVLFAPLSDSDTELEVYTGDGSLFPAAPFYLTLSPKNKWSRKINSEIVLVTAKSGDTFTITRAQKGTSMRSFEYGDLVANGIYKEDFDDTKTAAVTDAVAAALQAMMPVGFVVTLGVSTNPATLYGFGTWTRIQGRVVVGVSNTDTDFDLNDTGGTKTHLHRGYGDADTGMTAGDLRATVGSGQGDASSINFIALSAINPNTGGGQGNGTYKVVGSNAGSHGFSHYTQVVGYTSTANNLPPYISKYVWERTA